MNWYPHSLSLFDSDAFDFEYGTVIMRMNHGLDVSHLVEAEGQCENLFRRCALTYRKSCISITTIRFMKYFTSKLRKGTLKRGTMKHNNRK